MKQAILNLKKKLLIVEITGNVRPSPIFVEIMKEIKIVEVLGKLTDIEEEQFGDWVEKFYNGGVRDYREGSFDPADDLANFFLTAKESFFSYLEANGVLFRNPHGEKLIKYNTYHAGLKNLKWINPDYAEFKKLWQEAEDKVWNLNNCYIFEIL